MANIEESLTPSEVSQLKSLEPEYDFGEKCNNLYKANDRNLEHLVSDAEEKAAKILDVFDTNWYKEVYDPKETGIRGEIFNMLREKGDIDKVGDKFIDSDANNLIELLMSCIEDKDSDYYKLFETIKVRKTNLASIFKKFIASFTKLNLVQSKTRGKTVYVRIYENQLYLISRVLKLQYLVMILEITKLSQKDAKRRSRSRTGDMTPSFMDRFNEACFQNMKEFVPSEELAEYVKLAGIPSLSSQRGKESKRLKRGRKIIVSEQPKEVQKEEITEEDPTTLEPQPQISNCENGGIIVTIKVPEGFNKKITITFDENK